MPPGSGEGREVCSPGQLLLESALPRLNRGPSRYPTKDIFVISRGLTNVGSGLGKKGPGNGPNNLRAYFELFNGLTVFCTFLYYCL